VEQLVDAGAKVTALITCGKLRAAYAEAARLGRAAWVARVRAEAARAGQTSVVDLCDRFLADNKDGR
jgi:hypothetical protein